MQPKLIIIVPCFNEEQTLPVTHSLFSDELGRLIAAGKVSSESRILLVDDGSVDGTWKIIVGLSQGDSRFLGIRQSRNRGHQLALWAGLQEARTLGCDITVTIDCDGQDDVGAMEAMVDEYARGMDVVYGVRKDRSTDSFFKRITAEGFYRIQHFLGVEAVFNHADYRLLSARALDALLRFQEVNLFLRGLVPLVGFPSSVVHYNRQKRLAGGSHYGFVKMLSFAGDGITSLSVRPIHLILWGGLLLGLVGLVGVLTFVAIRAFQGYWDGVGVLSSMIALVGGLNLTGIGVVGEYVGKTYLETKERPRVIISERTWERK
ncbi:MAG: glycosyltransferase family 2 protein [Victivallales bacterium]|nr:glycosyltransferase family 2 protein [Victivallales bacterium]